MLKIPVYHSHLLASESHEHLFIIFIIMIIMYEYNIAALLPLIDNTRSFDDNSELSFE